MKTNRRSSGFFGYLLVPEGLSRRPAIKRAVALLRDKGYAVTLVPVGWSAEAIDSVGVSFTHLPAAPPSTDEKEAA